VIVAVMRLEARKRPMQLLQMLRRVRREVPDATGIKAVIIGDGSKRSAMERFIARHGMSSWIEMRGALDHVEIRDVFRDADVFVAPAVQESFGIAALEARAAGLPVVAMATSGIADFIEHDCSGALAADDRDMARMIVDLINGERQRAAIAAHNREVSPGLGWQPSLLRTERTYDLAAWIASGAHAEQRPMDHAISRPLTGRLPNPLDAMRPPMAVV
jgi:glycosyltransferase involved in cell wall biosynthesis